MKKVFMSTLMLLVAVIMSAATYSWEKVVTVTLTDGNNDTYSSRFGAAPELTDAASWGAVSANLTGATGRAYTTLGGVDYEQLYLNSIENLPLTVKTFNSANMTFTLTALYGEIKLFDNGALVLTVTKGGVETDSYECTVETNTTIADRFVINYVPAPVPTDYTVTPNAEGYATFSAAEATVIPAGVTVYKGAIAGEELQLTAISDYVPANTGVIVKGTAGSNYTFAIYSGSVDALEGNDLKPTSAYSYPMANVYVLKGDAFLEYVGTEALKANKAFIQLSAQSGAPKRIRMVVNHATGVENAAVEVKAEKFIENGQVLIRRGNEVYNLQGQKLR